MKKAHKPAKIAHLRGFLPGGDVAEQHSRFAADICHRQIESVQTPSKSSRRGSGFAAFACGKDQLAFAAAQAQPPENSSPDCFLYGVCPRGFKSLMKNKKHPHL